MRKCDVPVAMRPWRTLKGPLVHPKDKPDIEDTTECVYKVPYANCNKTYVGETGLKLGVRLQEHKTECESKTKRVSQEVSALPALAEINKSTLTDHANQENHMFNWSKATVIDRELGHLTRLIKEPYTSARKVHNP